MKKNDSKQPNSNLEPSGYYITVDPVVNIGIALFSSKSNIPSKTYLIKPPSGKIVVWENDFYPILWNFNKTIQGIWHFNVNQIPLIMYIERPRFMQSTMGKVAASSDALVKLASIYGACCYIAKSIGYEVKPLEIMKWKGNLSKEQVNHRIYKAINKDYNNHIADAVGMGLYLKGLL